MRLITRANLDGVTCAVLITSTDSVEQILFANPKDIEDGTVEVKRGDIIANLPFHPDAATWFDNHSPSAGAKNPGQQIRGKRGPAPSSARLVYEFYGNPRLERFEELIKENDRIDSADLTIDDVLNPKDWVLLSYTLDPFMGLENFHNYANQVIIAIKHGSSIRQILEMSDVKGRIGMYLRDADDFKEALQEITELDENVIVTDFRKMEDIPAGNRFIAFALSLYPDGNVQIRIRHHKEKDKVRIRMGKSIFNRTSSVHLGKLAAEYGGGGLEGAAGCLLEPDQAEKQIAELIERLKSSSE